MPSFRTGTVTAITSQRSALQQVEVDGEPAYVLTELIGAVDVGDRVVINTTAVDLGLGTGGWHVVHWNLSRTEWSMPGEGHQLKLRYTSLQADTGAAEDVMPDDQPSPTGLPVVACGLHSQAAIVAVVARETRPDARIAYVMTDAGALPMAMSDLVVDLRKTGVLDLTITAGQAFGGDVEAVNTISGIDIAARTGADIIIAGMGPGSLGTDSVLGFSGLEVAQILDGAASLGHVPIAAVRYSSADARERHLGVSHHTHTALTRFTHTPVTVPVPRHTDMPDMGPHLITEVDVPDVGELLRARGLEITSMGRGPDEDPGFFAYAGAAGVLAGSPDAVPRPALVPQPVEALADGSAAVDAAISLAVADKGLSTSVSPTSPADTDAADADPWSPVPGQTGDVAASPFAPVGSTDTELAQPAGTEPEDEAGHSPVYANDPPSEDGAGSPEKSGRTRTVRNAVEWGAIIVAALVAAFLIKTFLFQAFYIPSTSMDPTLRVGDRVLVNKLSYRLHDVRRGDIVVFERPPGSGEQPQIKDLIKRVIALPGDTIESRDGEVYINNRRLNEPYLPDEAVTTGIERQTVPEDRYWVMGDSRSDSRDSRAFSTIPEKSIIGRAFIRLWPVNHITLL